MVHAEKGLEPYGATHQYVYSYDGHHSLASFCVPLVWWRIVVCFCGFSCLKLESERWKERHGGYGTWKKFGATTIYKHMHMMASTSFLVSAFAWCGGQ